MSSVFQDVLFDPALNKDWQMQFSERAALLYILSRLNPDISIEIGTLRYGSLRPISAASRQVYALDIKDKTDPRFTNVTFVTGDSAVTLPPLINQLNLSNREVEFILIDGSHSEPGARADLHNCLCYVPKSKPTVILMHDSAHPSVRKAILGMQWSEYPHAHVVDVDFVPGILFDRPEVRQGQIWGGLAVVVLTPEKRSGEIAIWKSFDHSLSILMEHSVYSVTKDIPQQRS